MAFAIRETGERSKVAAHISTLKETGADGKPVDDQRQIESAKATIASEIAALPNEFNGVLVIAEGQSAGHNRSMTVQVIGQKGHF